MATPTHRRENIELRLLAYQLEERRAALAERKVELGLFVLVTIGWVVATLICAIKGGPWPVLAAPGLLSTTLGVLGARRAPAPDHDSQNGTGPRDMTYSQ